ncbi:S-adenosylmethionine decarboxylase proenzyme, prokaryotic class 1B [Rubellimicrobium mesophilum DSM 19309]|uniref:S-adenosylmethionine decarboxylase proenzyme n=1 Tax=Rubellimicrobium mesophilum DSM 19309 TaxID=442562 RepID=A0A017HJ98_9RHOB|nr:adenosylmethionine decarboxylase [Rubellimicrobium mesophilum]EYD73869.1 S-adenosylmethionine decarboxylase proenzyme, prokaryotic class 1B [Rubellimicrobium mesophilum DSM 19309]
MPEGNVHFQTTRPRMDQTPAYHPGRHLLADLYDAVRLTDAAEIEASLKEAAQAAGATILMSHLHVFQSSGGVTGMVLLAESHISIHTWPEHGFAAVDVFMCGEARAEAALEVIRAALGAGRMVVRREVRGAELT